MNLTKPFNKIKELLDYFSITNKWVMDFSMLKKEIGLYNAKYWRKRLEENQILITVEKNKYLININNSPVNILIKQYMNYKSLKYYLWWLYLFNKYWLTTQLPNSYLVFNNEINKTIKILNNTVTFKKVKDHELNWIIENNEWNNILDQERFLIEIIERGKIYLDIQELNYYFNKLKINSLKKDKLINYSKQYWDFMLRRVLSVIDYKWENIKKYTKNIKSKSLISLLKRNRKGRIIKSMNVILDF